MGGRRLFRSLTRRNWPRRPPDRHHLQPSRGGPELSRMLSRRRWRPRPAARGDRRASRNAPTQARVPTPTSKGGSQSPARTAAAAKEPTPTANPTAARPQRRRAAAAQRPWTGHVRINWHSRGSSALNCFSIMASLRCSSMERPTANTFFLTSASARHVENRPYPSATAAAGTPRTRPTTGRSKPPGSGRRPIDCVGGHIGPARVAIYTIHSVKISRSVE